MATSTIQSIKSACRYLALREATMKVNRNLAHSVLTQEQVNTDDFFMFGLSATKASR